jgi:7,8-dihydropterin-6-yl-methyl-4-(beta-D-ribofuranosyl)aminobenzene 5'-phosphate synthase
MPDHNCEHNHVTPSVSRRDLLCSGGAGFVTTLIGTLVGSSQTAQAQELGAQPPEVEWLAVNIVTDNRVELFDASVRREGFSVERQGLNMFISPNAPPHATLVGEFGLSMHVESRRSNESRNILIDFGYTAETLLNNLSVLKTDPAKLDALVLSHGHYDHFGGLVGFLEAHRGKLKNKIPFFVGGEDCFCTREMPLGQFGSLDRKAIANADLLLMMADGPALIADHAFTTGKIPLVSSEKPLKPTRERVGIVNGYGCFPDKMPAVKNTGTFIPDDFEHEIATNFVVKGKGLVVLTSCSHRGVINTIRQAQAASGVQKVHAVIGGFHIVPPLDDRYIWEVLASMKEMNLDYLIPGHCSGERFYDLARAELGDKVIHSAVGSRIIFEA